MGEEELPPLGNGELPHMGEEELPIAAGPIAPVPEMSGLALAPEGTRKKVSTWRSGFWHVAKGAGIPIVLVALDWEHKLVRLSPTVTPDEDDPADGIARIRAMYEGIRGYDPSRQG